jgi:hypothetical protein
VTSARAAGKAQSAQNAFLHGFNVPIWLDPILASDVEALAQRIVGKSATRRRGADRSAPRALLPPFSFQTKASTGSIWFKRFFADLTGDVIRAGSFTSVNELVRDIEAYLAERNANPKPYKWKAEGAEILSKRARAALDKAGAA